MPALDSMARLASLILLAAACALPASAGADVSTFGSDLSSPANVSAEHGSDTSYWNVALANGGAWAAPADGQITLVRLKGGVLPNDRLRNTEAERIAQTIHFQVLRPKGGDRLKVVELSTGHLELPVTTDGNRVSQYEPVNLCVRRGEIPAFNTIGAHEYRRDFNHGGADYQVFGFVSGSVANWYEKDNGLNVGTVFDPDPAIFPPMRETELLMQTVLATGPDATDICPGGYAQHVFRGTEIGSAPQPNLKVRTRRARLKGFCNGVNYAGCFGTLTLDATLDGQRVRLGELRISIPSSHTATLEVPIPEKYVMAIQRARSVVADVTADTHDNPRDDPRAKWDSIPVQQLTTNTRVTLKPDKPACVVPNVIGKSSASAKKKIRKAGCKSKVKRKKNASQAGRIIAQKPPPGTVLPNGSLVTITLATR